MESWKLNGCPKDDGGLAVNENGAVQTVWKRQGNIYAVRRAYLKRRLAKAEACTIETVDNKNVYAWTNDEVVFMKPQGQKEVIGRRRSACSKALGDNHVVFGEKISNFVLQFWAVNTKIL